MKRLLKILHGQPTDLWYAVYKPLGMHSIETHRTVRRTDEEDTVLRRAMVMTGSVTLPGPKGQRTTVALPYDMRADVRGALLVATSGLMHGYFERCITHGLMRRTYVAYCSRELTRPADPFRALRETKSSGIAAGMPQTFEGYVLRCDLAMTQRSERQRRVTQLFVPTGSTLYQPHPWLRPSEYCVYSPDRKSFGVSATKVRYTLRPISGATTPHHAMYTVLLEEGDEDGLRCLMQHYRTPLVNDVVYDFPLANMKWAEACDKYSLIEADKKLVKDGLWSPRGGPRGPVEKDMLEMVLSRRSPGCGLACTKVEFPDPNEEASHIVLKHLDTYMQFRRNGRTEVGPFRNPDIDLRRVEIQCEPPAAFLQSLKQKPLGLEILQDCSPQPLPTAKLPAIPSHMASMVPLDVAFPSEDARRAREHLKMKKRSTLRCQNCGGLHRVSMCPRLANSTIHVQWSSVKKFCVICGTRGHLYTSCEERKESGTCLVCGANDHAPEECPRRVRVHLRGFDAMGRREDFLAAAGRRRRRSSSPPNAGPSELSNEMPQTITSTRLFDEVLD